MYSTYRYWYCYHIATAWAYLLSSNISIYMYLELVDNFHILVLFTYICTAYSAIVLCLHYCGV